MDGSIAVSALQPGALLCVGGHRFNSSVSAEFSSVKSPVRAKLQLQFFSQRLALLEACKKFVKKTDYDSVDAHAFGFGPFLELGNLRI